MSKSLKFYFSPSYRIHKDGKISIYSPTLSGRYFWPDDYAVWDLLIRSKMVGNAFTEIAGMEDDEDIFELTDN